MKNKSVIFLFADLFSKMSTKRWSDLPENPDSKNSLGKAKIRIQMIWEGLSVPSIRRSEDNFPGYLFNLENEIGGRLEDLIVWFWDTFLRFSTVHPEEVIL